VLPRPVNIVFFSGCPVSDTTKDSRLSSDGLSPADALRSDVRVISGRYSDHPLYLRVLLYFGIFVFFADSVL
jgi:hypothetical protein